MAKKFLVFDLWSSYGHFKKPYTTSSPLTFSIPPRTAVSGIIAAICGIDKKIYIQYFTKDKADIAIALKKPVKKIRLGINLLNFNDSMTKIIGKNPTRFELLQNPGYRIYFNHGDENLYSSLKKHLKNHTTIYTPTMGLSENLANFNYIGEYSGMEDSDAERTVEVNSVVPLKNIKPGDIVFNYDYEYFSENLPLELDNDRKVTDYGEVIFEKSGRKITGRFRGFYHLIDIKERIIIL